MSVHDLRQIIKEQAHLVSYLQIRVGKLEKENAHLKACLRRDLAEQTVAYRDIQDKLEAIEKPLLKLIIDLSRRFERAVSYREIVKASENHPALRNAKPQTIMRRCRKLKEKKLLVSPESGRFYPSIKN